MQTRTHSMLESMANVIVGYGVAVGSQLAILPHFGVHLPLADNLLIGGYFTIISIARSYIMRRLFTRLERTTEPK
ncbi:MAG TPA: hypothetical protein PKA30_13375 [Accumulibacter sp.]|uniref:DUF7220 family protein n=1 Tax=Accumulibacter sp. TaxID=2053492 RepID=UPI002C73621A|nr:hypothetical protein [Accumulibacter sp.]HMV06527.1 hypothetical protein [Accumulibacter sp.]HND81577.1 hypothetical protein [Accumulibacter sp.]